MYTFYDTVTMSVFSIQENAIASQTWRFRMKILSGIEDLLYVELLPILSGVIK